MLTVQMKYKLVCKSKYLWKTIIYLLLQFLGDEFEFTVIQDQTNSSMFSNNRQSAIRMKWLPPGTVQFEIRIESDLNGVVSKDIPLSSWNNRSPTKTQNGEAANDSGLISYTLYGVKKSIPFFQKDCDLKSFPRVGDKVLDL